MKPDDKEALNELLRGAAFSIGVVALLLLFVSIFGEWGEKPQEPQQSKGNFTVVDTYKGCDVVQYNPDGSARYSYFLDCSSK